MQDKIFANGFGFKKTPSQPSYVVGKVTIRVNDAIEFLQTHEKDGWVNLDIKLSTAGKYYLELDTYQRPQKTGDEVADASANVKKKTTHSKKNDMPDYENDIVPPGEDDLPF